MDERSRTPRPKARATGLVVRELPEEVLVYDLERHRAVCLNRTAAFVWKRCDGRTSVRALGRMLAEELRVSMREELVWLALEQLGRDRLLEERIERPAGLPRMSRRELMRGLGIAAAASLPLVTSILAPTSAQAVSCKGSGEPCVAGAECCSGQCGTVTAGVCT